MYLGIEIGGTKLQLGVGAGTKAGLAFLERREVDAAGGAEGIRAQIVEVGSRLLQSHAVRAIGLGFGGPVDAASGHTITSFQIAGWDNFPLADWARDTFGRPAFLENDSNLAGLAEARWGAGKGYHVVLYSNAGSGIGGALVVGGRLYLGGAGRSVTEIGHLRPGPQAVFAEKTVESVASGWGIARQAAGRLRHASRREDADAAELLRECDSDPERLTGKSVVAAAVAGNRLAGEVWRQALDTYGWALAQAVTLLAPNVVVLGGGLAQVGEEHFLTPLRQRIETFVIPSLAGSYRVVSARLGEEVVVHGAITLAADHETAC